MDWTLEVVVLPVSDIDRSGRVLPRQARLSISTTTRPTSTCTSFKLTPTGSGCSIVIGDLPSQTEMAPGSMRGLQLVVADAAAARQELLDRGVEVSEIHRVRRA